MELRSTRTWKYFAVFFFFQAEDGIRDRTVTGVQTCALPISYVEEIAGDHIRDVAWILAHHWKEAGESSKAVTYLILAAERALESMAKDEAIRLYDDAVELIQDAGMRARVRLQRALSLIELTDFDVGAEEIDELLPDLHGSDEIDALLGRARASIWLEQPDEGFAAAARAKQLAEERGDAERLPAALAVMTGRHALLRGLIETAEKIGRPKFGAPSMNYLSLPFRDLFLVQEARRLNEEALEVVRREGGWGMPGMQAEIDLMITDLLRGDIGRAERD